MVDIVVNELVASVIYESYFQVSSPQILHNVYKHVNKCNMTKMNIKKQTI